MNSTIPAAIQRTGINRVSTNKADGQHINLKAGVIGLFFGDELAEALLKRQQRRERKHGRS
ncbi:hypothetical protein [Alteromonas sp. C1M14]|uniref:hypothetical protein n=1 Tax=Alteromonas sp. C1M14 TaxID=2841567 RepID=UPI001C0978EF|nr:hypothetical protein [Alteromonas sp. C1M14]MBU2979036.1 hypothetical protein [Alteromonas sp. C1M14]